MDVVNLNVQRAVIHPVKPIPLNLYRSQLSPKMTTNRIVIIAAVLSLIVRLHAGIHSSTEP